MGAAEAGTTNARALKAATDVEKDHDFERSMELMQANTDCGIELQAGRDRRSSAISLAGEGNRENLTVRHYRRARLTRPAVLRHLPESSRDAQASLLDCPWSSW